MKGIYAYRPLDPTGHPAGIADRAPDVLATWLTRFPESQPRDRDEEDWIENAILLHEADRIDLKLEILPPADAIHISGGGWSCPVAQPGSPVGAMIGYWANHDFTHGLPVDMDPVGSDENAVRIAGGYATSPVFLRHAGRTVTTATGDVEGEDGIEAALRRVVDATSNGGLFIKTVQKGWSGAFQVDPRSGTSLWRQLCDADDADEERGYGLSWIPVQHEGSTTPILLVQGRIRPTYEYRMFVVDGRPVTGAGCIEAFTPAENDEVFDPQVERIRSDGVVITDHGLRDRYLAFAEAFAHEFGDEHGQGLDYSLDLCVDAATNEIRVIEINPPLNLGRYASDVGAWLRAVVDRTERVAGASV